MKFSYSLAVFLLLALAVPCNGQEPNANIWCTFNKTTGQVTGDFSVFRNISDITTAYFVEYLPGTNTYVERNEIGCGWTGSGSNTSPFLSSGLYSFATDSAVPGRSDCGAQVEKPNEVYAWYVHAAKEFAIFQDGDVIFKFICNITNGLPDELSISGSIEVYDTNREITASGGLAKIQAVNDDVDQQPISSIELGQYFQLQLNFQPDNIDRPITDERLAAWGVYCDKLYASPRDFSRRVDMLDQNGCPRNDEPFLRPARGLVGFQPDRNKQFIAHSGIIEAARFDKSGSNLLVITCEIKTCWAAGALECIDRCAALTGRRKKRTEVVRRVNVELYVTGDPDTEGKKGTESESVNENKVDSFVWIIIGVGAALVITVLVVGTICVLVRMKPRKYKHQHDSYTSSNSASSAYAIKP